MNKVLVLNQPAMPSKKARSRKARRAQNSQNSKKSSGNAADVRDVTSHVGTIGTNELEGNGKSVDNCKLRTAMASSKHQEIDVVEVLDNWEDIEDSDVLERKFRNLKPPSQNKCNGMNGQFNIILTGDDALRSQYVPPEPTVTILKRPTKQGHAGGEHRVLQPKKTLKQREQEYAEARLRILGEAASPERPEDSNRYGSIQHGKGGRHAPAAKAHHHNHNQPQLQQPQPPAIQPPHDNNVIRLPKGPDGSKGFEKR